MVKNLSVMQETRVGSLGWEGPLEKQMPTHSSILAWRILWTEEPAAAAAKSLQSCPTLWDFMDCSPPGCTVHGIFQARILEWVGIPFFRGSFWPKDRTWISCTVGDSLLLNHWDSLAPELNICQTTTECEGRPGNSQGQGKKPLEYHTGECGPHTETTGEPSNYF